jgi:hypothetical protein
MRSACQGSDPCFACQANNLVSGDYGARHKAISLLSFIKPGYNLSQIIS